MRFGLLATIDSPYLPLTLAECRKRGLDDLVVILDRRANTAKDKEIWEQRFGIPFAEIDLGAGSLFDTATLVPTVFCRSHNDSAVVEGIAEWGIDALANAGTPRKLSPALIEAARHGIVNVHPGVLPRYRGCTVVEWAMYNGDPIGNTAHFMTEGYDEGPIIEIETYPELAGQGLATVRREISARGCALIASALDRIQVGRITPGDLPPQEETQARFWQPIGELEMARVLAMGSSS